ncbi:2-dehydropantoate 2-reductase [Brooklawnia cerclae]|uniref:2-dehydropantoate 2-reductase n=1 Tax=Brooklawnia cerclae TaxID=349934 RepID=A0ABX0SLT5_9ACTN|nr:2-dehydropantoate 2-reductase [Brooklawnia cerclae]NIH58005.1 2-dehydropantoate 2-reductase [Brooklawnia cerclae]
MKFAIIGAGGLGGYFGAKLAAAGHDVGFVVRGRTLGALRTGGLHVIGESQIDLPTVTATDDADDIGPVDAVLLTVKTWQLPEVVYHLDRLVGPSTLVLTMQNGIRTPEQVAELVGREHVAPAIVRVYAKIDRPGRIDHMGGPGTVTTSTWDTTGTPQIEAVRAAFEASGIGSPRVDDIWVDLWEKAVYMIPYGLLGALSGLPVGGLRTTLRAEFAATMAEVAAVGRARGVALSGDVVERTLGFADSMPAQATSSMQRDLLEGRPSELEALGGDIVRSGRETGVPVPRHELLYSVLSLWEAIARQTPGAGR